MKKILIIQTAFIGDTVLATGIAESLHAKYPEAALDFLLRKGNEGLLHRHPFINEVIIWDKRKSKIPNLFRTLRRIRASRYDLVINLQRFMATGILTAFSGAGETRGFINNPLSFLFGKRYPHKIDIDNRVHEIERNHAMISDLADVKASPPKLYPSPDDEAKAITFSKEPFVTMTPSSVWFTKKYPKEKWIELIDTFDPAYRIYLLGGKDNAGENEEILKAVKNRKAESLAGKMNFLESAALMKKAVMNYVNDSAPLHFCSAMNAPVTAIFCSTVPGFGFYPLSDVSFIIETGEKLPCRPCGLHGRRSCPEGHFKCALTIPNHKIHETTHYHAVRK